jgi:hypothetical protein
MLPGTRGRIPPAPGTIASAPIVGSGGAFSSSNLSNRKVKVERLAFVKPGVAEWLLRGAVFILGLTSTLGSTPGRTQGRDEGQIGQTANRQQQTAQTWSRTKDDVLD